MSKEPTVNVPVTVFLELMRHYELQSQEQVSRTAYIQGKDLERRAYRKYQEWKKGQKDE